MKYRYISKEEHERLIQRCHPQINDVLITKSGTIGRTAIIKSEKEFSLFVSVALIKNDGKLVDSSFLKLAFDNYISSIDIKQDVKGGLIKNLHLEDLREIQLVIPPLNEQARIVAKIEELFTKLDAGIDALRAIQKQIKRYRQAVLRDAVTGELTKAWREANQTELEPADALLKRILIERRNRWEQEQLEKFAETSKTPKNDDWKEKYKAPAAPDTENVFELPNDWTWATIQQLASFEPYSITDGPFGSNLKTAHYSNEGVRVLRLQNIGDGEFIDAKAFISQEHFNTLLKHQVKSGDLVVASLGEKLPKSCIVPEFIDKAIVKADCLKFQTNPDIFFNKFANFVLNSEPIRNRVTENIHGVGRPRLNLGEVRQIALPLPPLAEQQKIVEEVERLLSVADAIEQTVKQSLKQAERLRQSILKRAFEGKLVPQDETDEPASILLERIKQEREEEAQIKKEKVNKKFKSKQDKQKPLPLSKKKQGADIYDGSI